MHGLKNRLAWISVTVVETASFRALKREDHAISVMNLGNMCDVICVALQGLCSILRLVGADKDQAEMSPAIVR